VVWCFGTVVGVFWGVFIVMLSFGICFGVGGVVWCGAWAVN
jgi:hypothetical protein